MKKIVNQSIVFALMLAYMFIPKICDAQSLVGKWKEVSTKQFFNAETAKKMGKASVQYPMRPTDVFIWELKADNTYTMTDGTGKDTKTTGEWSVKGDQLTIM